MLVGFAAAKTYLGFDGHPSTVYVRARTDQVDAVQAVLAPTANPETPSEVTVSQPSAALVARAKAKSALNGLFLGLGAVSLLVGAVGVANIMVISVLERRSEIGLRRALGATRGHVRIQFLAEAVLLAMLGGAIGVGLGALSTAVYARAKDWAVVIPGARVGWWTRRGFAHRRDRRAAPRAARRPDVTDGGAVDRLTESEANFGGSLADVVERMYAEFGSRLPMPARWPMPLVVTTVRRCRRELDIIDGPALPELLERLARQRLWRIIEAGSAGEVGADGVSPPRRQRRRGPLAPRTARGNTASRR